MTTQEAEMVTNPKEKKKEGVLVVMIVVEKSENQWF